MKLKRFTKSTYTFLILAMLVNQVMGASSITTFNYNHVTLGRSKLLTVYLSDGYDGTKYFPTLYLLHGGGGNNTDWTTSGNAKSTLDNAISTGNAKAMIVIMPSVDGLAMDVFTKELVNDIIPYTEKNYRAIAAKDSRALAGLSMGGLMTLDAGLYRHELFGYLGVFSSGWLNTSSSTPYATFLKSKGEAVATSIHYFYWSDGGASEIAYQNGLRSMAILKDNGVAIDEYISRSGGHSFTTWKADLVDFIPHLFIDAVTSVDDNQNSAISVFPSPFTDGIEISSNQTFKFIFYTLEGKEMEKGHGFGNQITGRLLPQGNYILQVQTGKNINSFKVLKK